MTHRLGGGHQILHIPKKIMDLGLGSTSETWEDSAYQTAFVSPGSYQPECANAVCHREGLLLFAWASGLGYVNLVSQSGGGDGD